MANMSQEVTPELIESLQGLTYKVMLEWDRTFRLMKNGQVWDYSMHLADIEKWADKIIAEDPSARVEVEFASTAEAAAWRGGW